MNINYFTVRQPKILRHFMIGIGLFVIILCVLLIVDNPILPSFSDPQVTLMILFFLAIYISNGGLVLAYFHRWKIHVEDRTFHYNPGFGFSKRFTLEDIKRIKYENIGLGIESITLYSKDKVLISVRSKHTSYNLFHEFLIQEGLLSDGQEPSSKIIELE